MNILVTGNYSTGSSAVYDYLREFNNIINLNDIKGIGGKRLNAIYRCTRLKDGKLICGGQYERVIMTLE